MAITLLRRSELPGVKEKEKTLEGTGKKKKKQRMNLYICSKDSGGAVIGRKVNK